MNAITKAANLQPDMVLTTPQSLAIAAGEAQRGESYVNSNSPNIRAFTVREKVTFAQSDSDLATRQPRDAVTRPVVRRIRDSIVQSKTPNFHATNLDVGVVLQDWEGCVVEVRERTFIARLLDHTRKLLIDTEEAEIPIEEIDPGDREMLQPNSIFYLTIKRRMHANRKQETVSRIVFRRLPAWHASMLAKAIEEADELATFFEQNS